MCENFGKEWSFQDLKELTVSQEDVLKWSSSIEIADQYATYWTTGLEQFAQNTICNCSSLNTFGKFCEYEFITKATFEDTIQYQFDLKRKYRNGSQLWGNITCYKTRIACDFGLRCLAWQNICDGKQQCANGIDEDRCEELQYNECEENEYRCQDGSCIPEQYWLDGEYDCSDQSDEQILGPYYNYIHNVIQCPLRSSQFKCDEATSHNTYFACGDGEFTKDELDKNSQCYNFRMIMFFCEYQTMWTLDNGHCVRKGWIEKNLTMMNESEKCIVYLKCMLTNGRATGCDDVIANFHSLCLNKTIEYPVRPVVKPYVQTVYEIFEIDSFRTSSYVRINGCIKCGYDQTHCISNLTVLEWFDYISSYPVDSIFCYDLLMTSVLNQHIDKYCWNQAEQSFLCLESLQCISKHRLRNGIKDCISSEDEHYNQTCHMKKQHRLNCSGTPPFCLSLSTIGDRNTNCNTGDDEYIVQMKWDLVDRKCEIPNSIECTILKAYIQSSTLRSTGENYDMILFRQYCDTVWQLPRGFDESLCHEWICPRDEYRCLSGHCIPKDYVINQNHVDWHCPDASDKIGLFRITQLSEHNAQLIDHHYLQQIKDMFTEHNEYGLLLSFDNFCNHTTEYGCILANVNDSLNFTRSRPCINLTQIGDGTIDCYGGLDERNLLTCGKNIFEQRGFDFHCDEQECIPYDRQCEQRCSNGADSLLCDQLQTLWSSSCEYPTRSHLCQYQGNPYCDLFQSRLFYCDEARSNGENHVLPYRYYSWIKRQAWIYLPEYLAHNATIASTSSASQQQQYQTKTKHPDVSHKLENDGQEGWICGRGVAIKINRTNKLQCFCPPSLYGDYCQYFSDRITAIVSLSNIPKYVFESKTDAIKILVLLLSNDDIIDQHVFHLPFTFTSDLNKKFRFNLLHRRPKIVSNSYTVRFEGYQLMSNSPIKLLAVWEYSIQFPFLPSYRLVQILRFEDEQPSISVSHICRTANLCLHGSTCYPITNRINATSAYYCLCKIGSFGKRCEYHATISSNCSRNALSYSLSFSTSICLCSIHTYGPTCHLNHTCMNRNPCGSNRGTCYTHPDNITRDYICICQREYFGDHCEYNSAMVKINFTDLTFIRTPSKMIMSSIIQLCDLHNETLNLFVRQKRVYQRLPPSIIDIYHNDHQLPILGILKVFHQNDLSNNYLANLKQTDYFLLYITPTNISRLHLTSVINMTNYCPSTTIVFQKNISDVSYLSQVLYTNQATILNMTVMIFKYHVLCNKTLYALMCFHDDHYLCVCDVYDHAECFRYDPTLDYCHEGRCRANGQCIHGDLDDRKDFVCLCPQCYYGSVCQHNTELFSFTLETLLTNDLYSSSMMIQQLFSSLLIIIPIILFLIGVMNNFCCYVTFNRKKPLLVGTGHYLRTATVINQLTLLILVCKLIHLVLTLRSFVVHHLLNTILCKLLSYLLSCTSRMSYWLMGMVGIERVYVTWYLQRTWLKSPRIARRIILTIISAIILCNIHEIIYYQSIDDPKATDLNNSTWCVTSYPSTIGTYNQINIILNYIVPFLINFLSTIILIILITRKRSKATGKRVNNQSIFHIYFELLNENKDLIVAPLVTMLPQLFSLPQLILSFSLACQEFQVIWQRYLLIISYFILYLPQTFSFGLYISPSKFYQNEFHATKLYRNIIRWRKLAISKQALTRFATQHPATNETLTQI